MAKRTANHSEWRQYLAKPNKTVRLSEWATRLEKHHSAGDYHEHMDRYRSKIADLQAQLRADGRYGLLVIFQGMDAAGKDSAIKHVMSCLNPLGALATAFAQPSSEELRHDFLWRTHAKVPARGMIGVFNRSYYEETVVVRLHPELLAQQNLPPEHTRPGTLWKNRLTDIRHHEDYLHRQGFRVLKFFLHISKSEQRQRLLARLDEPAKRWKVDISDFTERALWRRYQATYGEAITATSTAEAPWFIIPSDDKKTAHLLISRILIESMSALPLHWPQQTPERLREMKRARARLEREPS